MHTDIRLGPVLRGPGLAGGILLPALIGVAILLVLTTVWMGASPSDALPTLPPEDRLRLAQVEFRDVAGTPELTAQQALDAARREYDWTQMGSNARAEAFFHVVTVPALRRHDGLFAERPVWIVRLSGVTTPVEGPPGTESDVNRSLNHAYVFIDARSGEFLFTSWTP